MQNSSIPAQCNFIQATGEVSCLRCPWKASDKLYWQELLTEHLNQFHPNWQSERLPYTPGACQAKAEIPADAPYLTDEQPINWNNLRGMAESQLCEDEAGSERCIVCQAILASRECLKLEGKLPASLPAEGPETVKLGTCSDFPNTPHPQGTCENCNMWTPLPTEGVALPPLRMTTEGTPVYFFPSMNPERRAKLKAQWARLDEQDCRLEHYKPYEWNLRNAIEQLEVREEQFLAEISESAALRKQLEESKERIYGLRRVMEEAYGQIEKGAEIRARQTLANTLDNWKENV